MEDVLNVLLSAYLIISIIAFIVFLLFCRFCYIQYHRAKRGVGKILSFKNFMRTPRPKRVTEIRIKRYIKRE